MFPKMFLARQCSLRILYLYSQSSSTTCPRGAIISLRHLSSAATNNATTVVSNPVPDSLTAKQDNVNKNNDHNMNKNNNNSNKNSNNSYYHNDNNNDTRRQGDIIIMKPGDNLHGRNSLDMEIMESIQKCSDCNVTLEELRRLASQPCTPLSLSDMYKYASANANSINYGPQRLRNAQFLHKELPIRVAQRAVDLLTLPHGLNKTVQVQEVTHKYLRYLRKLIDFPCPTTEDEEIEFTDCLREIVQDRKTIPITIAQGVSSLLQEQKHNQELDSKRLQEMEKALYRFFNARIGLRLLAEHHILSCVKRQRENDEYRIKHGCLGGPDDENDASDNHEPYLGCIQYDCNPYIEARKVANKVMKHCKECYGITPEIEVLDCTPERYADSKFTYVPHHLQYTLAELLKNSCRATITRLVDTLSTLVLLLLTVDTHEQLCSLTVSCVYIVIYLLLYCTSHESRHAQGKFDREDHVGSHHHDQGVATDESLPSVRVVIAKGAEDVTIKIADRGGGVPRSVLDKMWSFAHSNTSDEIQSKENDTSFETDEFSGGKIRGFGLPLARIYARYFGGELTLKSMEGYGVDAYLYLPMLGKACENLPKRVLQSPGNLDSVHDGNHHVYYGDSYSSAHFKNP